MKKTFTINISGTVFHIDEDAYEKLNNYIFQINRHFGNDADAREIVEDIESRISELFQQRIKDGSEVITIDQVNEIIAIMGLPEAIGEAAENGSGPTTYTKSTRTGGKRLYRDPDEKVLGGVCSGLGAFFNFDPIIIRLIFVLLVFLGAGSSIIIYLILWIVVPKASGTAQKLEMKGEEVNINNISKSIKDEIQDVKENFQNYKSSKSYARNRDGLEKAGNVFVSILRAIFKIIVVFFGILILFIGVVSIIALFTSLFVTNEFIGITPFHNGLPQYLDLFVSGTNLFWFWIGAGLVVGIPLIMLIYLGAKMIFRFKSNNPAVGMSSFGLWLIGLILLIFTIVRGFGDFKSVSTTSKQESLTTKADTLVLKVGNDEFSEYLDSNLDIDGLRIASVNGKQFLLNKPHLDIVKSDNNEFSLVIQSKARGRNLDKAQNNAKEINYKYNLQDSLLTFQPWFMLPENSTWHKQEINLLLKVPMNKTIFLSEDMTKLISDVKNTSDMWDGDMGGKYWTMKPEGLTLTQRKQPEVKSTKK